MGASVARALGAMAPEVSKVHWPLPEVYPAGRPGPNLMPRAAVSTAYPLGVWTRPSAGKAEVDAVLEAIARKEPPQPGALQLVAFAKAYSGLTDEEFRQVDAIIRRTTLEKFGPVRSVRPSLVFELGFEGINRSTRHKSGIAVRFPRMLRIRHDKPLHEADTLAQLELLLGAGR
mgnify:CR=1 FL=1